MPPRSLTAFEVPIAATVVELGALKNWEFAAYLKGSNGPLIEMRCLMRDDGADPSQDVLTSSKNNNIVVHHNHLSQESLSFPDWKGLATIFSETFAHCLDGTIYWGRVVNHDAVMNVIESPAELNAQQALFNILYAAQNPSAPDLAFFFRKEVINRAMARRCFVEYEYSWGTLNNTPYVRAGSSPAPGPAGIRGSGLDVCLNCAASVLAPTL